MSCFVPLCKMPLRAQQEITWTIPIGNVLQIQLIFCPRNRSVACTRGFRGQKIGWRCRAVTNWKVQVISCRALSRETQKGREGWYFCLLLGYRLWPGMPAAFSPLTKASSLWVPGFTSRPIAVHRACKRVVFSRKTFSGARKSLLPRWLG